MYLQQLSLQNYKSFSKVDIDFKRGINLLIGDNGVGKTSLLDGIATGLKGLFVRVEGVPVKGISKEDVRIEINNIGDASSQIQYFSPVCIGCSLAFDGELYHWDRVKEELFSSNTKTNPKEASIQLQKTANTTTAILPLISYQSTARVWKIKRGDFGNELSKRLDDRRCGYIGCLDSEMDVNTIKQWCLKQEVMSLRKGKKISEYELFKKFVTIFMQKIDELPEEPKIYYSSQAHEMVYEGGSENIPVSKLSAGYQSLLWMIMDLAYRAVLLNPEMKKSEDLTGIVLIDEIDMHLHPKWQWTIINALEQTFKNVQFIIATHSPIVISSAKNAHLIVLQQDHTIEYLPDSFGYDVGDVLRYRQESINRPRHISELINEIENALDLDDISSAFDSLLKLKTVLGEKNSEYKNMEQIIKDAQAIQELDT